MPVSLWRADRHTDNFWNDSQDQEETFLLSFQPESVEFDPMLKILSSAVLGIEDATLPPQGGVSTMYLGPNPAGTSTTPQLAGHR